MEIISVAYVIVGLAFVCALIVRVRMARGPGRVGTLMAIGTAMGTAIVLMPFVPFATYLVAAGDGKADGKTEAKSRPEGEPARKQLVKPRGWPEGHPLPLVGSNCAACHLTAGRELTAAVQNFVRSTHDLNQMTCYDCHGGNTRDDAKAHGDEFGFIGTKKSAHIENCTNCHDEAAAVLASGPHAWDFSKRINTEYPLCFDCHGNHDIGNPPSDFKLVAMCGDCHEKMDQQFPNLAGVVKQNDRLWDVLRQAQKEYRPAGADSRSVSQGRRSFAGRDHAGRPRSQGNPCRAGCGIE